MILRCMIVDDEPAAGDLLGRFIERTPGLVLAVKETNPLQILTQVNSVDIVFLDIDMPQLSGTELAKLVPKTTSVIFTTSFREFAPEAFEVNAIDYLLKPILYERFLAAIQKVRQRTMPPGKPFMLKTGSGQLSQVLPDQIIYIAGLDNYVEIHLTDGKLITYITLSELAALLPQDQFSRIHRSHIIAHRYLSRIEQDEAIMTGGKRLTIGRSYRQAFMEKLRAHWLFGG